MESTRLERTNSALKWTAVASTAVMLGGIGYLALNRFAQPLPDNPLRTQVAAATILGSHVSLTTLAGWHITRNLTTADQSTDNSGWAKKIRIGLSALWVATNAYGAVSTISSFKLERLGGLALITPLYAGISLTGISFIWHTPSAAPRTRKNAQGLGQVIVLAWLSGYAIAIWKLKDNGGWLLDRKWEQITILAGGTAFVPAIGLSIWHLGREKSSR